MKREKDLQDACVAILKELGIYHINTHGGAFERRGRPDLYICLHGRFVGVELKRGEDEEPSPLQRKHLNDIERSGGIGAWIYSIDQFRALVTSGFVPTKRPPLHGTNMS